MQKSTILPLTVAGLLVIVGAIYLVSAYREPTEAIEDERERGSGASGSANGGSGSSIADATTNSGGGLNTDPELNEITLLGVVGLANLGIAAGILIISNKKRGAHKQAKFILHF
jgi:hypothetical protein